MKNKFLQVSRKASETEPFYDVDGNFIEHVDSRVQTRLYPPIFMSEGTQNGVISASGCGDCLVAGVIRGIQDRLDEAGCIKLALQAASLSLSSFDPVPATLTAISMSEYYS